MFSNQDNPSSPLRINTNVTSSTGSSGEVKTRPTGDLKGKKDFKKVLQGVDPDLLQEAADAAEEVLGEELAATDDTTSKKGSPSPTIFSMSKQMKKPSMLDEAEDSVKATPTDAPNKLFSKPTKPVSTTSGSTVRSSDDSLEEEDDAISASKALPHPAPKQEKFNMKFSSEQQDLSYVNPLTLGKDAIDINVVKEKPPVVSTTNIQDLINQMVKKVEELEQKGQTNTIVTLKQPPIFDGANLVVTEYDSAKGEFNISFENLRNEAKTLLDAVPNREALHQALIDKGYTVHIISTTTQIENPIIQSEQMADRERDPNKQQQQQKQQQEEREGQ